MKVLMECQFENCNQDEGHKGPHGFIIGPGFIVAPYGGGEGAPLEWLAVYHLKCTACEGELRMRRNTGGGGIFKCQSCDQSIRVSPDGGISYTVIPRLYPSAMQENTAMYSEFLQHQLDQGMRQAEMARYCGAISYERARELNEQWRTAISEKRLSMESAPWRVKLRNQLRWLAFRWIGLRPKEEK